MPQGNKSSTSTSNSTSSDSQDIPYIDSLNSLYTIIRELGSGTYGTSILVRCHLTNKCLAIKLMKRSTTQFVDFLREFNLSKYLSSHSAIVNTYEYGFETPSKYGFAQELATYGDLFEFIQPQIGLQENCVKLIVSQVVSALDFMHSRNLVHRDIKPENVLVFENDFSVIKLTDFGMTRDVGTLVRKVSEGIPYTPPEISGAENGMVYRVETGADIWSLGVLTFVLLTGNFPWEIAHQQDIHYQAYTEFRNGSCFIPPQFERISTGLLELFSRMFDEDTEKRGSLSDVSHFMNKQWLDQDETNGENCPSCNSPVDGASGKADENTKPKSDVTSKSRVSGIENFLKKFRLRTKSSLKSQEEKLHVWFLKNFSYNGASSNNEIVFEH